MARRVHVATGTSSPRLTRTSEAACSTRTAPNLRHRFRCVLSKDGPSNGLQGMPCGSLRYGVYLETIRSVVRPSQCTRLSVGNPQQQLHTSSFYFRSRLAYLPHSCRIQSRALFPVLISVDNERMGSSGASTNTFERRANPNDKLPPT